MESKRIGFIGAGQMAEALARGFINKGIIKAENIYATDIMQVRKDVFASFSANAVDSNSDVRLLCPACRTRGFPKALAAMLICIFYCSDSNY
jgi:prephenate dehydrogenase